MSYAQAGLHQSVKPTGVCVDLSPQLNERLDEISARHGVSKVEIIKRAFALFDVAIAVKNNNERLGVFDKNGKLIQEVVGLL
jgi:hypothetical protein